MSMYEIENTQELEDAMAELYKNDAEMLSFYTVQEIVDDAVTSKMVAVEVAEDYMKQYEKGTVCQY